jgi:hypothetical protein
LFAKIGSFFNLLLTCLLHVQQTNQKLLLPSTKSSTTFPKNEKLKAAKLSTLSQQTTLKLSDLSAKKRPRGRKRALLAD